MAADPEFTLVLTTAGSPAEAGKIARTTVEQRLAACVQIVAPVTSVFRWDGEIREEEEQILIIKTRTERLPALQEAILAMHSYDCPEIVEIPVAGGFAGYLDWVRKETATD
jgi:periplasmic divalent cation tolerance protein